MRILHAALPGDWAAAAENGSYDVSTRGVSVVEADFIHASTIAQLPGVLDRHYGDVPAVDLLVLDVDRLDHEGATITWEAAEHVPDGPYPHIYGVVPVAAVVDVVRLRHASGEPWQLPALSRYDVAIGP